MPNLTFLGSSGMLAKMGINISFKMWVPDLMPIVLGRMYVLVVGVNSASRYISIYYGRDDYMAHSTRTVWKTNLCTAVQSNRLSVIYRSGCKNSPFSRCVAWVLGSFFFWFLGAGLGLKSRPRGIRGFFSLRTSFESSG